MGQTDRPDDRRVAGSRLPPTAKSAVKRNHETPKSGIPKRKKIEACPRLSCKIQYLLASNHRDQSTTSEYFTDDEVRGGSLPPSPLPLVDPFCPAGGKRGHQNLSQHKSHRRAADRLVAADPFRSRRTSHLPFAGESFR